MTRYRTTFLTTAALLLTNLPPAVSVAAMAAGASAVLSSSPFYGRWDITLIHDGKQYPSWLEIDDNHGQPRARMVGRWGHARYLPSVAITGSSITFVSPKEEEGSDKDLVFTGKLTGKTLAGTLNGPDGSTWSWRGVPAPALKKTGTPRWGAPITLFNGKDLTGWHPSQPGGDHQWTVQQGTIVSPGNGPELVSDKKFQDFKLHLEFNCGKDSNAGVYVRGRYEVQIETESQAEPNSHHTGGVYGYLDPTPELSRSPDTWQTYEITLIGRYITVVQNGKTVIDNKEIPGITGGAVDSHEATPGPIYLQGSEKGHVAFRNIVITPAL